jgi:Na+-driven multidrug efflux pump
LFLTYQTIRQQQLSFFHLQIGTYLNLLVGTITSGVFSGMGRPIIATILSFGLELPMSIGGVAIYILVMHGDLLGVYWWTAISGAIELVIVFALLISSDWEYWADEARKRQETGDAGEADEADAGSNDDVESEVISSDINSGLSSVGAIESEME